MVPRVIWHCTVFTFAKRAERFAALQCPDPSLQTKFESPKHFNGSLTWCRHQFASGSESRINVIAAAKNGVVHADLSRDATNKFIRHP
jgi:hypothetical protein